MSKDNIGDRMKAYEHISRLRLMRRTPVIIRLDGKAFHTFTKGFIRPFDDVLMKTMQDTTKYLCENIQGCVVGYTQSDEITLVLVDYKKLTSDAWFDNQIQKMVSVSSSMATLAFNRAFRENARTMWEDLDQLEIYKSKLDSAMFDARAFSIPKEDVNNCLLWRQQDASRNSIQMVGQANFSHSELQGKSCNDIQSMLLVQKDINWNNLDTQYKRGTCCIKERYTKYDITTGLAIGERTRWKVDYDIPIFSQSTDYINSLVYIGE